MIITTHILLGMQTTGAHRCIYCSCQIQPVVWSGAKTLSTDQLPNKWMNKKLANHCRLHISSHILQSHLEQSAAGLPGVRFLQGEPRSLYRDLLDRPVLTPLFSIVMEAFAEGEIEPFTQDSLQTFSSSSLFFHSFSISVPLSSPGSEMKMFFIGMWKVFLWCPA